MENEEAVTYKIFHTFGNTTVTGAGKFRTGGEFVVFYDTSGKGIFFIKTADVRWIRRIDGKSDE